MRDYCLARKRDKVIIYSRMSMNLEHIRLSERIHLQKGTYRLISRV